MRCGFTDWVKKNGFEKMISQEKQNKIVMIWTIFLFAIVLIPLLAISHYAVKSADDYGFFFDAENVLKQTHSIWALIKERVAYAADFWKTWQGTYFYFGFGTMLMGICGDRYYFVGAYLTYASFVLGEYLFMHVFLRKVLGAERYSSVTLACSCILMQLLLMPAPVEGFYWFTSSILYLFVFGLSMVLLAFYIELILCKNGGRKKKIALEVGILLLEIAVGGSNYVSIMLILTSLILIVPVLWVRKASSRFHMTANTAVFLIVALCNICAPGNQIRMASSAQSGYQGYSAVKSILMSLKEAAAYIGTWTVLPYVIAGLLLAPFMIQAVKRSKFRFPYPFLVTAISFGVFASQFTPSLYTMGFIGAMRIQNIYRTTMLLWLYGNELYWIGYYLRKAGYAERSMEKGDSFLLPGWCLGILAVAYSLIIWGGSTVTFTSALDSFRSGQARRYRQEYEQRMEILEDSSIREAYLPAYSAPPYLLYREDISENTEDWVNKMVADLYGKDVVGIGESK